MVRTHILVGFLVLLAACSTPPEDVTRATTGNTLDAGSTGEAPAIEGAESVPVNPATSSFEFEGYGVGKSHVGTFEEMRGTLTYKDGAIVAAEGVIDAASVKTDSSGLDDHLRNEDFFHVEQYPEIRFESSDITAERMVGTLTFHGVTKEITMPLSEYGERLSSEFMLSMEEFGISYKGVNDEVRIAFTVTR